MSSLDLRSSNPVPAWLPDETLFSLLSRFHRLSGHRLASDTCRMLFGTARAGCQHDFPTRLGELCERLQDALGCPIDLARQRTLLPFYLPLQRPELAREAISALTDAPNGVLKFRLGILTSRFRANHPLKACPDCITADSMAYGIAYWHLVHQLPGVWLCATHGSMLCQCLVKSTGVERFGWILPAERQLQPVVALVDEQVRAALDKLAGMTEAWSAVPRGTHFDSMRLAATYHAQLTRRYGSQALSTSERAALSDSFFQAVAPLRCVPELQALPGSAREAWLQIQRWILAPRGGTHPLRHLTIILWLFEDWPNFRAAYEATDPNRAGRPVPVTPADDVSNGLEAAFLAGVRSGLSISAAARRVGVTANTGMAWAARHGNAPPRRPKTLRPEVRAAIVVALGEGGDKTELAHHHGVSVQAVTRILQTEPRLRETWQRARNEAARDRARSDWGEACSRLRGLSSTLIRREAPAAYAWLYRNDRVWLTQHRPESQARADPNRLRVDWDTRDLVLGAAIHRVAAELIAQGGTLPLQLWQFYQRLPELKAKLGALDRLPLTRKAIQEVMRQRRTRPGVALL